MVSEVKSRYTTGTIVAASAIDGLLRRGNKYGARKTVLDGITFDSAKEAARWRELQILEAAGSIRNLRRQVRWPLSAGSQRAGAWSTAQYIVGHYKADFDYEEWVPLTNGSGSWQPVTEDVKALDAKTGKYRMTELAAWKLKHFSLEYAREVRLI